MHKTPSQDRRLSPNARGKRLRMHKTPSEDGKQSSDAQGDRVPKHENLRLSRSLYFHCNYNCSLNRTQSPSGNGRYHGL